MIKRTRRTDDARIAELQAAIERIKLRAAQRSAKKDATLRHISGAVRAIDKATNATKDKATREALAEARATLAACLALKAPAIAGVTSTPASRGPAPDADRVLAHIKKHPGVRAEELCAALGTDALTLRPVLHGLRDEGRVKVDGKARATRYTAAV